MELSGQTTKNESYQALIERIDKNSEGWDVVMEYRDTLYRRFFSAATTDHEHFLDHEEFVAILDTMSLQLTAKFLPETHLTYDECRIVLLGGIAHEWLKRTEKVESNIMLGNQVLANVLKDDDLLNLLELPTGAETSR